jgi:excisionase family DNA binding protein
MKPETKPKPQGLLSVQNAAELLGTSTGKVYKLCADRKLGHVRMGTTIKIPADYLYEFLSANTFLPQD